MSNGAYSSNIRAAALVDGSFIVTETARGDNPASPTDTEIFAQRFDGDGATFGARFPVNGATAKGQFVGTPVALTGGGFAIVWNTDDPNADVLALDDGGFAVHYDTISSDDAPLQTFCAVSTAKIG